jgi:hypothetical protein
MKDFLFFLSPLWAPMSRVIHVTLYVGPMYVSTCVPLCLYPYFFLWPGFISSRYSVHVTCCTLRATVTRGRSWKHDDKV